MDDLEGFKTSEYEENIFFFLLDFDEFDCSLLWGLFYFSLVKWSAVSLSKWPFCIVSHPAASGRSFYSRCSPAKATRHLCIYCHKQPRSALSSSNLAPSLRGRKKIDKRDKRNQPKARSIRQRHCCCLTSDRRLTAMCANRHWGKEKYSTRLWTFPLCFWVAECSPSHEYQGQPPSIIHNPAVLRCPYLHLYCRTSKWLPLFNIVAASPHWLLQLKDQPELLWGKKVCTDGWQAGKFINKDW